MWLCALCSLWRSLSPPKHLLVRSPPSYSCLSFTPPVHHLLFVIVFCSTSSQLQRRKATEEGQEHRCVCMCMCQDVLSWLCFVFLPTPLPSHFYFFFCASSLLSVTFFFSVVVVGRRTWNRAPNRQPVRSATTLSYTPSHTALLQKKKKREVHAGCESQNNVAAVKKKQVYFTFLLLLRRFCFVVVRGDFCHSPAFSAQLFCAALSDSLCATHVRAGDCRHSGHTHAVFPVLLVCTALRIVAALCCSHSHAEQHNQRSKKK